MKKWREILRSSSVAVEVKAWRMVESSECVNKVSKNQIR